MDLLSNLGAWIHFCSRSLSNKLVLCHLYKMAVVLRTVWNAKKYVTHCLLFMFGYQLDTSGVRLIVIFTFIGMIKSLDAIY